VRVARLTIRENITMPTNTLRHESAEPVTTSVVFVFFIPDTNHIIIRPQRSETRLQKSKVLSLSHFLHPRLDFLIGRNRRPSLLLPTYADGFIHSSHSQDHDFGGLDEGGGRLPRL